MTISAVVRKSAAADRRTGATEVVAERRRPVSILILFSDTGGGHRAAASAIDAALRRLDPEVRLGWCDPLLAEGPPMVRRVCSLYPGIVQRAPATWALVYHVFNSAPAFFVLQTAFGSQVRTVVARHLRELDPDLVISVHPLLNHVLGPTLNRGRPRGLMTVVTDLVGVHRGWGWRQADRVVVATEEARRALLATGLAPDQVALLGLPLRGDFRAPSAGEAECLRRGLGLEGDRPTILVAGGGEGSGRLFEQVQALGRDPGEWQLIAVCGRNERLRRRLLGLRLAVPIRVLGFVGCMPELLRASDLLVTKAGPGAIAEALATRVPLVLTGYLPGQEAPNLRYATGAGVAVYEPVPRRLPAVVHRLLVAEPERLRQMRDRAGQLARPSAAADIAALALECAGRYQASSHTSR